MSELIRTEVDAGVATITLAKVEARNSIDIPMAEAWCAAVQAAAARDDIGVILVRADGPAWCVGGAIDAFTEVGDGMHAYMLELGRSVNGLVSTLHETDKVTIAAVHGAVGGGGVGFMAAHDIVLAQAGTVFALGYSRIGTTPDGGNSYFVTRDVGYRRALELYLLNERLDADQAHALGIINRVIPKGELDEVSSELARRIARGPWTAHAGAKVLLRRAADALLARQLDDEIRYFADNTREADFAEGLAAFLAKRSPSFHGGSDV